MADLDALAPNYRRVRERWHDAPTLSRCHDALIKCFDGDAHGLVEHVKSFIEVACVTVLAEFGEPMPSSTPTTTELLVAALRPLGLQNARGASKLDKVLSGFNRLTDALSEMRNDHGAVAHGRDAFLDGVAADHARAFLHAGDAILSVLLNALEGTEPDLTATREPWERFPHLNERIDQAVGVEARIDEDGDRPVVVFAVATGPRNEAIEIRIEPSRLLYGIDRSAYIEILKTVGEARPEAKDDEDRETADQGPIDTESTPAAASRPLTEVVPTYSGRLAALRPGLEGFLHAEGWRFELTPPGCMDLTDSLLATADQNIGLDWKQRAALQARLKVAFRRVLMQFGSDAERARGIAQRLVTWMRIQAPDAGEVQQRAT
jgi:hypothetical protein